MTNHSRALPPTQTLRPCCSNVPCPRLQSNLLCVPRCRTGATCWAQSWCRRQIPRAMEELLTPAGHCSTEQGYTDELCVCTLTWSSSPDRQPSHTHAHFVTSDPAGLQRLNILFFLWFFFTLNFINSFFIFIIFNVYFSLCSCKTYSLVSFYSTLILIPAALCCLGTRIWSFCYKWASQTSAPGDVISAGGSSCLCDMWLGGVWRKLFGFMLGQNWGLRISGGHWSYSC